MKKGELEEHSCDVLVIGAGGAGIRAAIEAHDANKTVILLGKSMAGKSHTVMAEGGINAALGNMDPEDSTKIHMEDTLREGQFLGNAKAVETLCREAPNAILELEKFGSLFDRTPEGKIIQRPFGAHRFRRTCHIKDRTGLEIIHVLLNEIRRRKITNWEEIAVTNVFADGRRVIGAIAIDLKSGKKIVFQAKAIVLATGGFARLWLRSSNPWEALGDGQAIALELGADLMDLEMVQFHPTGMAYPKSAAGMLVTESVRGEGGILYNAKNERFMEKYDKKRMELSARDVVARSIFHEVQEGRGTPHKGVWLDITHKGKKFIEKKLPGMVEQFQDFAGVDIRKERMEVTPTAHYTMGGIKVEAQTTSTTIPGLFAVGEVTAGIHGANRLGGNSLADILVFGKIAGKNAADFADSQKAAAIPSVKIEKEITRITKPFSSKGSEKASVLKAEIQQHMWNYVGIERNKDGLKKAFEGIQKIKKRTDNVSVRGTLKYNVDWLGYLDVLNMVEIAEAVIISALTREESRGAHYRSDFPEQDENNWRVNLVVRKNSHGKLQLEKKPVMS